MNLPQAARSIMVVDDQPENLKLLEKLLRGKGYDVRSFPRGRLALEAAALRLPDLVLLDANMPEMTGYEMCARLKSDSRFSEVPVIFLSGVSSDEERSNAFAAGAVDFISKPFFLQEVYSRVATHLELSELRTAKRLESQTESQDIAEAVDTCTRQFQDQLVALRRLVELRSCSDCAVIVSDTSRVVTSWNSGAKSLYGWEQSEVIGKVAPHCLAASSKTSPEEIDEALRRTHYWEGELIHVGRDGRKTSVLSSQVLLHDALGLRVLEISSEVRDPGRLREQSIEAHRLATLGRLAREMAHDFNNLLTLVRGYSAIMLESELDPASRQMLTEIFQAGLKASSLNGQLSRFSRRQAGAPVHVSLNLVVTGAAAILARLLGERIELVVSLDDQGPVICADLGRIEQVLIDLAMNARDAMPSGGMLFIETSRMFVGAEDRAAYPALDEGRYSLLDVSQTHAGVRPEAADRTFEPFAAAREVDMVSGSLSLVQRIAEDCGGALFVSSKPGPEIALRIVFPSAAGASEEVLPLCTPSLTDGTEAISLAEAVRPDPR